MQITQRIDYLGRRDAGTLATATTQRLFGSTTPPNTRQGINLVNADASADLYATFTASGASAPTISATDYDVLVSPKTSRTLQIGPAIDVWIRSSSAGTINYTAQELQ